MSDYYIVLSSVHFMDCLYKHMNLIFWAKTVLFKEVFSDIEVVYVYTCMYMFVCLFVCLGCRYLFDLILGVFFFRMLVGVSFYLCPLS